MDGMDNTFSFDKILLDMQLRLYESTRIDFNNVSNCIRFTKKFKRYGFKNLKHYYINGSSLYIYRKDRFNVNYIQYRYINDKNFKVIKVGQDGKVAYFRWNYIRYSNRSL